MWILKKFLNGIFSVLLILVILDIGAVLSFAHSRPAIPNSDAVVILGAAINTPALTNRTLTALHLYEEGKADSMVLSGGRISDEDISEAGYMQKVIRRNAQVMPQIIIEDQSHSTYDNLKNSRDKLGEGQDIIIVSDEFHLARSVLLAKRLGFGHVSWDAPQPTYYRKGELVRYYLREMIAMFAYIPKFIFG
jgi:vancomycin permeability regulator SanA